MKTCIICLSSETYKWYSGPTCRKCWTKAYNQKYYVKNESKLKKASTEYVEKNRQAANAARKAWKKANPEKQLQYRLKQNFNLSLEQFRKMEESQNGLCGICSKKPKEILCVDHCHSTGKIRGLLCRLCNSGIGALGDNEEVLRKALAYLSKG